MIAANFCGLCLVTWWLGRMSLLFGILFSIGALVYWIRVEKEGAIFKLKNYPRDALHNLLLTYFHLICSYAICFTVALWVMSGTEDTFVLRQLKKHSFETIIGTLIAMTVLTTIIEFTPFTKEHNLIKTGAWALHSAVMGLPLSLFGAKICVESFFTTIFLILLATLIGYAASNAFLLELNIRLFNWYCIVFVCSGLCLIIINYEVLVTCSILTISLFGGIMLYTSVFAVNTNYIINEVQHNENYDPQYTSAVKFLCTINIFIRAAMYYLTENYQTTEIK